jgi:tRNA uridine 5-carboxymethylaminomethyl modification enzyme
MTAFTGDEGIAAEAIAPNSLAAQAKQQAETQIKYQGYIDRQTEEIERLKRQENTAIPADIDYSDMQGLSNELRQKLAAAQPENIGRASRISGMTPAAISLLLIHVKKHQGLRRQTG